jgi:PIN domain nuclease of toxin-antitoxin system
LRLLLDTHTALWWLAGENLIGDDAKSYIADETNQVLLSAVVVWEVAIKRSLGRLEAPAGFASSLLAAGAQPLAVSVAHAEAVEQLPWHHRDPFDRMLVAQALIEGVAVISGDEKLLPYGARLIW